MFLKLRRIWNEYGFEILVVLSIIFLVVCAIYCYFFKEKGTWSGQNGNWTPLNLLNNNKNKYNNGNIFSANYNSPPSIKESRGEAECRRVLERIFKRPFPKIRPDFLSNPVTGGANLEIDCYNKDLKLGVEYSGIQHYQYTPFFHKNKEAFQNQKYRDEMKRVKCRENGVTLIEVPYTVDLYSIESYIISELMKEKRNNMIRI